MLSLSVFIICTYILSNSAGDENLECPTISDGYYPFCVCKDGLAYDFETNTCLMPECPVDESVGTYPNCTCQQKNFDYSSTLNVCFQVCPENSNGYWPKCNCDYDGYVFDKERFQCVACPADSTGQYPDCNCGEDSGTTYDPFYNNCTNPSCPYRSSGNYPNCSCENGVYNGLTHECDECPYGESTGIYPNCVCENPNSTYDKDSNLCFACPFLSTGQYPNCECEQPFYKYVPKYNRCIGCPENSEDIYPNCHCLNGYYSETHRRCMECPTDATGLYPACECNDKSLVFSAFINECYRSCPKNGWGIQPNCKCDDTGYYYDNDDVECKSNSGRVCPLDSIGVGPDCLCIRKDERFYPDLWDCISVDAEFSPPKIDHCPGNGKWPQCEVSIDIKVLLSSVG